MVRFDAYSATTKEAKPVELVTMLREVFPAGVDESQGRGFHQFGERLAFKGDDGSELGAVMWGGRQADWVMVEVKGEHTPEAVKRLRERYWHRCTRVDSCADFDAPRAFERLYRRCIQVKRGHRIIGGKAGDWEDFPEKGRTLYLGAKTSTTRLRLYEKGKQPEYLHLGLPNLARIEVQVRPAKDSKGAFASLDPLQVWGASRWSRELAGLVLLAHVDPHPAGTVYRKTTHQAALEWACKQYGAVFSAEAEACGGWDLFGRNISEIIEAQRRAARRGGGGA